MEVKGIQNESEANSATRVETNSSAESEILSEADKVQIDQDMKDDSPTGSINSEDGCWSNHDL